MTAPLTDATIAALAQLVDDSKPGDERRVPSHSDIEFFTQRNGLTAGDPKAQGQTVGKAKRVRAILYWAIDNNVSSCLVSCDHIPRRSWPLFRAKAMLGDLIAGFSSPGIQSHQEQLAA